MDRSASEWLEAFAEDATDGKVANDLARSLRKREAELDVVQALMRMSTESVRSEIAWALYEAVDISQLLPAVFQGLRDQSSSVRYWCALALRQVNDDTRTEAVVRLFDLLGDDAASVRRAAISTIMTLGQKSFELALESKPSDFDIDDDTAARIELAQGHLKQGYLCHKSNPDHAVTPSHAIIEAGFGMRLAFQWRNSLDGVHIFLGSFSDEVRSVLIDELQNIVLVGMSTIRARGNDTEPKIRTRTWLTLNAIASEVTTWRKAIVNAAKDDDKTVRETCFLNLKTNVSSELARTILESACARDDDSVRLAALDALTNLLGSVQNAIDVENYFLQKLCRVVDDDSESISVRTRTLAMLQSHARIVLGSAKGIDWESLLSRSVE